MTSHAGGSHSAMQGPIPITCGILAAVLRVGREGSFLAVRLDAVK
jgi:hypothetical protein